MPRIAATQCVNPVELLGRAKVPLPKWRRKSEISREMIYGEIKAGKFLSICPVLRILIMFNQQPIYIGSTTIQHGVHCKHNGSNRTSHWDDDIVLALGNS